MSRNLGRSTCCYCDGPVTLDEAPRPLAREDAGYYFDEYLTLGEETESHETGERGEGGGAR